MKVNQGGMQRNNECQISKYIANAMANVDYNQYINQYICYSVNSKIIKKHDRFLTTCN